MFFLEFSCFFYDPMDVDNLELQTFYLEYRFKKKEHRFYLFYLELFILFGTQNLEYIGNLKHSSESRYGMKNLSNQLVDKE